MTDHARDDRAREIDTNDSWRQGFEEGYAAGIADAAKVAEKWERQPVGIRSFRDPDDDGWLDIELIFEEGRAEHLIAAAIRALSTSKGE